MSDDLPLSSSRREERDLKRPRKRAPRVTVSGVLGELLLTAGFVMMLFLGWKFWLNDIIVGNAQNQEGAALSEQFDREYETVKPPEVDESGIPIRKAPTEEATPFAVLYVPAWGEDYSRTIATGITRYGVLDYYVGYYPDSDPVGSVGNFAIAGHRLAYGASMQKIPDLQLGDNVYVETVDGWYEYTFRAGEYVGPSEISILSDVPRHPELKGEDRIMLLMTCNPFHSTEERVVSYTTFVDFIPRSEGPPEEIAGAVNARTNNNGGDTGGGAEH